ncbi:L-aspartate 1-decarboxylase [Desulfonispora thiosulfatigenes DSM 11270]|uniref:Aspartate 1-decarboxylase n=1 Tax=Desulfonispora thiosulfatigenes DSM 11270 TaxID=656914 RepID=A0A1W1VHB0_DESTI|nr:aspartate 1-decarboxylase [Desulfonispora thiosulfatigenes]SMB92334.1 L-aspartate 1-decarboxylase [Desulfonispora thiosulfatigenes DSM 11270]
MFIHMLKSKIHRAKVTEANLDYVGSITIDQNLMDAAGIYPNEKVQIVNNNNGARLETYTIAGKRGSGIICLNGAAARLVQPNDILIIISYCLLEEKEVFKHKPMVVFVNDNNKITHLSNEEKAQEISV